jgi:uncharacterized membrane protein YeaQ/YmgE (transglycosylase-associated protein family)
MCGVHPDDGDWYRGGWIEKFRVDSFVVTRPVVGQVRGRSGIDMLSALIFWIIVGLIAGALAKWVMPGDDPGGIIVTIIIGIVGAVIGGYLLRFLGLGGGGGTGQWIGSIIAGFIGAVILLAIYRLVAGRRTA